MIKRVHLARVGCPRFVLLVLMGVCVTHPSQALGMADIARVVEEKLDLQQISDSVASDEAGAIATFIGV